MATDHLDFSETGGGSRLTRPLYFSRETRTPARAWEREGRSPYKDLSEHSSEMLRRVRSSSDATASLPSTGPVLRPPLPAREKILLISLGFSRAQGPRELGLLSHGLQYIYAQFYVHT